MHKDVSVGSTSELPALKNIHVQIDLNSNWDDDNTESRIFPKTSNNFQKTFSGRNVLYTNSPLKKLNYNNAALWSISPGQISKQKFTPEKFLITQKMLSEDIVQENMSKHLNELISRDKTTTLNENITIQNKHLDSSEKILKKLNNKREVILHENSSQK